MAWVLGETSGGSTWLGVSAGEVLCGQGWLRAGEALRGLGELSWMHTVALAAHYQAAGARRRSHRGGKDVC
eukprot:scaffold41802_cov42-Phaeocystis_antarctica.AAC.1